MGSVYTSNKALEHDYVTEDAGMLNDFLVDPSKDKPQFSLAKLSLDEVTAILKKLDSLAPGWSPQITLMLAEGAAAVIQAVRLVKALSKQEFRGIFAQGNGLDLRLLRPKDIGGAILRGTAAAGTLGLYGGGGGAVYTWYYTGSVSNVTNHVFTSQTMEDYGALVYLGFIDPIEVPPIEAFQFTLNGIPVSAQSCDFKMIKTFNSNELPVVKVEKPIIVPPMGQQALDMYPYRTGNTRIQPVGILVARFVEMTL